MIGDFKNPGRAWASEAERVNVHDFPTDAEVRAVPYGIYDITRQRGHVVVGTSADTPAFAADAIVTWWETEGSLAYPNATELLILADAGGSNAADSRLWKEALQRCLSDRFDLIVTVCHYPTGCSKWNPIEHRLFCFISRNWAGIPLRSLAILLALIRGTSTATGLSVTTSLVTEVYQKGLSVANAAWKRLQIERHAVCPKWNYTIRPRKLPEPRFFGNWTILASWELNS